MPAQITYDHQIFATQEYGGISRYFVELATRISQFAEFEVRVLAPIHVNRYLRDSPELDVLGRYIRRPPFSSRILRNLNAPLVASIIRRTPTSLIHETSFAAKQLIAQHVPVVLSVYDMIHERYPGFFSRFDPAAKNKVKAVKRADHIICISESTRNDLITLLKIDPAKTSVIHLASSLDKTDVGSVPAAIPEPFILYVGQRRGYKNFYRALQAYSNSKWLRSNFSIVCCGGGKLARSERESVRKLGIPSDRVIQVGCTDQDLAALYVNASLLLYPSLYEGFGIPLIEAMSMGCPVACSNTSSMPEIAGPAAIYFNPTDVDDMAHTIEEALESATVRERMITTGKDRAQRFSWDRCAELTRSVYLNLL